MIGFLHSSELFRSIKMDEKRVLGVDLVEEELPPVEDAHDVRARLLRSSINFSFALFFISGITQDLLYNDYPFIYSTSIG